MAQATVNFGGLVISIRTVVEDACRSLAEAIARNCTPGRDIAGVRQMALDNAYTLWPMLHSRRYSSDDEEIPQFQLIVFGAVPDVRAEIIYANDAGRNIIFVRGPTDKSAEAAVEGLLETTMAALDQQYEANVFREQGLRWTAARLPHARGSGWYGE